MPASADELKVARSWIGTVEADATFQERFDRLAVPGETSIATLNRAIEESLRAQLAVLVLDQPGQLSTGGNSFNWSANIKFLGEWLEEFIQSGGVPDPDAGTSLSGVGVARLYRRDIR